MLWNWSAAYIRVIEKLHTPPPCVEYSVHMTWPCYPVLCALYFRVMLNISRSCSVISLLTFRSVLSLCYAFGGQDLCCSCTPGRDFPSSSQFWQKLWADFLCPDLRQLPSPKQLLLSGLVLLGQVCLLCPLSPPASTLWSHRTGIRRMLVPKRKSEC